MNARDAIQRMVDERMLEVLRAAHAELGQRIAELESREAPPRIRGTGGGARG